MRTNITKQIFQKRKKKVLLLNRENNTLIILKIIITYSSAVTIEIAFAPKIAQGRLLNFLNTVYINEEKNCRNDLLIHS